MQMTFEDKLKRFREPLQPNEVIWKAGEPTKKKNMSKVMPYIDNRAVLNRLDDCFGAGGWQNKLREVKDGFIAGLMLKNDEGEWLTRWDGAGLTDFEAVKGGISDAQKRAAHQWGLGRELYSYPDVYVYHAPDADYLGRIPDEVLPKLEGVVRDCLEGQAKDVYWLKRDSGEDKLPELTGEKIKAYYADLVARFKEGISLDEAVNGFKTKYKVSQDARNILAKIKLEADGQ